MRPLELKVAGFRSYRDPAVFDWRGRRLVGIVGPIGSGKSTILDAVSFALFGKTPSIERDTRSLINQSSDQCHVELRFEVEGQVWLAVRALRRKGQAGHALHRLASDEADPEALETVTGEKAVNARVAQLLGMDFDAFCRSVLLAQNRFSEFLHATPTERDRVLKSVFGYDRLSAAHEAAKVRLAVAVARLEDLEKKTSEVQEARNLLQEARSAQAAALKRSLQLKALAVELDDAESRIAAALAEGRQMQARMDELAELAKGLPPADEVHSAIQVAAGSAEALADARAALGAAVALRTQRESELAQLIAKTGDRDKLLSFERLVIQLDQQASDVTRSAEELARGRAQLKSAEDAMAIGSQGVEKAGDDMAETERELSAAAERLTSAQEALLEAQHADMALTLRASLSMHEPCPVCRQPVHKLPPKGAAPKVGTAQRTLAAAEKAQGKTRIAKDVAARAHAAAQAIFAEAAKTVQRSRDELERIEAELKTAESVLASTQTRLTEWLGEGDPRSLLAMRAGELALAEEALAGSNVALEAARDRADAAAAAGADSSSKLGTLANRMAGIWGRLGEIRQISAGDMEDAYVQLGEAIVSANEAARVAAEAAGTTAQAAADTTARLMYSVGLAPGEDFHAALNKAEVDQRSAEGRVGDLEQRVAIEAELKVAIDRARRDREIAARLAEDLKPSRFLAFLLQEERTELAELGSEHFELLTDGGFRFAEGGDFEVADLDAAGSVRKADSLSGGETFIASLALALALAQMVARSGGSLDSFFLDEGFGSLDPEHLDRAMDGISRLVASDDRRLVVLVSHVAEMREAIEDLIVLDKDPVTGDSVVRSGAVLGDFRT